MIQLKSNHSSPWHQKMNTPKIIILLIILTCRNEAAPPSSLPLWLNIEDTANNELPTLRALVNYLNEDRALGEGLLKILPSTQQLRKFKTHLKKHQEEMNSCTTMHLAPL